MTECPTGRVRELINIDRLYTCVCQSGQEEIGGECFDRCYSPEVRKSDNSCGCPDDDKELVAYLRLPFLLKECMTPCPSNKERKHLSKLCVCPSRKPHWYNNSCHPCRPTFIYSLGCRCPTGKEEVAGVCLPRCLSYLIRKPDKSCGCPSGQHHYNNGCHACPQDQHQYNNGCHACPQDQHQYNNGCHHCAQNSGATWDGSRCVCPEGQTLRGSVCENICPSVRVRGTRSDGQVYYEWAVWNQEIKTCVMMGSFSETGDGWQNGYVCDTENPVPSRDGRCCSISSRVDSDGYCE